ncbi:MAG: hypothetical protein Q7J98_12360 [Kiritimatiellia bacterium]|nr:hypothetical protein [Kiritimatiellia bacterium]
MYSTIKAEIEHGRIIPLEKTSLPDSCQVLVTILTPENGKMPQWDEVEKHLGFILKQVNGQAWQKTIRSEWENRK